MSNKPKIIRYLLGAILIIVAINAFGGGYYGMAGAENVPVEWLQDSPFKNYFFTQPHPIRGSRWCLFYCGNYGIAAT